jgi:CheY-like chemotaxis protein/anti-sigma regulatory factor (Ser/Thr protein kinase)
VVAALRIRAKEKNLDLRINYATAIPDRITTDPTRVRQILINLLGNALKFTESGSVTMTVRLSETADLQVLATVGTMLHVDVTDTGIGIAERDIFRLFQPFTQVDVTTTRRFGGTGLGLTISRRLAQLLGGDVTVRSLVGIGSTFTVGLATGPLNDVRLLAPSELLQSVSRTADIPRPDQHALSVRVLLVDDAPDNRLLVTRVLQKHGATVDIAENGREGADRAWQAFTAGEPYDVVLMDIQMPVLDGFGATRELRERGYDRPIVALTANAQPSDLQQCREAGCDAHAAKPIDRVSLFRTITELSKRPNAGTAAPGGDAAVPYNNSSHDTPAATVDETQHAIDRGKALRQMGGSEDLVREVAQMVIELLPAWLSEMERNLETENWDNLKRLAHTLKTSAENVGARGLADASWQLESSLRDSQTHDAGQLLRQLAKHASPALNELEDWLAETSNAG